MRTSLEPGKYYEFSINTASLLAFVVRPISREWLGVVCDDFTSNENTLIRAPGAQSYVIRPLAADTATIVLRNLFLAGETNNYLYSTTSSLFRIDSVVEVPDNNLPLYINKKYIRPHFEQVLQGNTLRWTTRPHMECYSTMENPNEQSRPRRRQ